MSSHTSASKNLREEQCLARLDAQQVSHGHCLASRPCTVLAPLQASFLSYSSILAMLSNWDSRQPHVSGAPQPGPPRRPAAAAATAQDGVHLCAMHSRLQRASAASSLLDDTAVVATCYFSQQRRPNTLRHIFAIGVRLSLHASKPLVFVGI